MQFWVAPVSAISYVGLMLGGLPLHFLQLLLVFVNVSITLVFSLLIDILLLLFHVLDPNRHALSGRPLVLPSILLEAVDL